MDGFSEDLGSSGCNKSLKLQTTWTRMGIILTEDIIIVLTRAAGYFPLHHCHHPFRIKFKPVNFYLCFEPCKAPRGTITAVMSRRNGAKYCQHHELLWDKVHLAALLESLLSTGWGKLSWDSAGHCVGAELCSWWSHRTSHHYKFSLCWFPLMSQGWSTLVNSVVNWWNQLGTWPLLLMLLSKLMSV